MARKRHLASTARGFYGFCLTPSIRKQICPNRGGKNPEDKEGLFLFIALRWMQDREGGDDVAG